MVMYKFANGTAADADQVNSVMSESLTGVGLGLIRSLQDRDIDFSAGSFDWFGDAYIDSDGREDSVTTGNTTMTFNTDRYEVTVQDEASGDTLHDPNSFSDTSNAFDNDDSTYASKSTSNHNGSLTVYLGKTFNAKTITTVKIKSYVSCLSQDQYDKIEMVLQTYNGSSWSDYAVLAREYNDRNDYAPDVLAERFLTINSSIQGLRVKFVTNGNDITSDHEARLYSLEYGTTTFNNIIEHDVTNENLDSALTSSFVTGLIYANDNLTSFQYKLDNGSDDTGYVDFNEVNSHTAFSSGQPTTLTIKANTDSTSVSNPITNPSFEDAISSEWTYSEDDTDGNFSDDGRVTNMKLGESDDGSYSYKITISAGDTHNNDYARITQTSVDLSNIEKLSFDWAAERINGSDNCDIKLKLVVGNANNGYTIIGTFDDNNSSTGYSEEKFFGTVEGTVPVNLRESGQTVYIQYEQDENRNATYGTIWWFDNFQYEVAYPSIKGFSLRCT